MDSHERRQKLLGILRDQGPLLAGSRIAELLGVTSRTVRSDVRAINASAASPVIAAEHRGYSIVDGAAPPAPVVRRESVSGHRIFTIAQRLMRARDGIDAFDLAASLSISDSALEADLTKVRTVIREFDLALTRSGNTIRLTGRESDRRRLVRQLLLGSARGATGAGLEAALHELNRYPVAELSRILEAALAESTLDLHDYELIDLTLHLAIALERIDDGHSRAAEDGDPALDPRALAAAAHVGTQLEADLGARLPDGEVRGLAELIGTRIGSAAAIGADDENVRLVRDVVDELSAQYALDITDDAFVVNLGLHVRNMLDRARAGHSVRNPLRAEFKQSHPLIHDLAVFVASRIEGRTGVSIGEDEIVYLALHLGTYLQRSLEAHDVVDVVCVVPRHYDSRTAFIERLSVHLGDTVRLRLLASLLPDWAGINADLIVSVIELPVGLQRDAVAVTPIPSRAELDRIGDAVRRVRHRKSAARIRWTLTELLDPRLFRRVARTTRDEALRSMCEDLTAAGVASDGFHEDVLARERLSSTAFGGQIAVPHSFRMDCSRTAISVVMSEEPIDWGGSSVRMVVLFALSPTGRHAYRDVLGAVIAMLSDEARVARIVRDSADYEDFVRAIVAETSRN
ncbi:BglG family transcription antiterminator [Schumannella luteola]|nr:PRD domain-containing protein [Schumannella luteola]TPW90601.1 transcription antiterminator [Schumannella luteola]